MARLLLADRVKGRQDSFLAPLLPALSREYDVQFISSPPGENLAEAIRNADLVWLEWCWDHAVWATKSRVLAGKPCLIRLHSIEALQTDFPSQIDWSQVSRLVTVGHDITSVLLVRFPTIAESVPIHVIPNGIDIKRFAPGNPDPFRIAWVGHLEPKKNPMLLFQIAHRLSQLDERYSIHVAGPFTDLRTMRYAQQIIPALKLNNMIRFEGVVTDMPAWYADKGIILSTTMYESFGMNIGEAMSVGAFPVIHDFPGADLLWPAECLFASVDDAVGLIRTGRPGLYRNWVGERYSLEHQEAAVLRLLKDLHTNGAKLTEPASGLLGYTAAQ
jgi:glycosyltransferase involved in cell wall biosynthesis